MANKLIFKDAEAARDAIMASQKKEIADLYESWADEIGERAKYYSHKSTASAPVSERYYRELQKQIRQTSQEVSNEIYKKIKSNIYTVADAVVSDNVKWLEGFGFSSTGLNAAFSYVPHEIVQNLVTGQIYNSGWSLSSRIWGDNEQTLKDIYQVMAKGLAENKPIYHIAKDLEKYVRPSAQLPWNLRMADGKKIYKKQVDYNAQRLARTLVQHGYQQSFIATTQKNPFITEYVWRSNGSRVCELCLARDGVHYKKNELPMDHPNGMCTMEPVVADDMIDRLADWFNSPDGTYPEIDEFAGNFGYNISKPNAASTSVFDKNIFINKFGNVNNNNALPTFKSKLSSDEYSEWFSIQKSEKKALGYGPGSGKDFWADYTSGKVKSDKLDEFFAKILDNSSQSASVNTVADFVKKYGTSTKSPNAWFNSLTPIQKAEAKALKEQSGLTWNKWYEKNIYSGSGVATSTKATEAASTIPNAQPAYLSKFTKDTIPTKYKDFYNKLSYDEAMEFKAAASKALGVDLSSMPYSKASKLAESYFKDTVLKQVTSKSVVSKIDDIAAVAVKDTTKTATTKAVASKIDDAFDATKWYDTLRKNDLDEFNNLTKDWLKTISTSEKRGVVTYTGDAYWDMNAYLRGQQSSTRYKAAIKNCQAALSKASLPRETIVRRGADYNMLDELKIGPITPQNKSNVIGAILEDKGFMSTSPAPQGGFTFKDIEYVIKLPQGSQAMYVDSISKHKGEEELLINCGGKFTVEDVGFDSYGNVNKIFMTLINLK